VDEHRFRPEGRVVTPFTPWTAAAGGILIGAAAAFLLLGNGRIAGISGILGGALQRTPGDTLWKWLFLLALPVGALGVGAARGGLEVQISGSPLTLVLAGLLVGFGTRLGNGCTSGHGVCGMARGSGRSIAATLVFMATAMATVFVVRHGLGG
jgi:uncharacterized membrane protein YedE/YeeE